MEIEKLIMTKTKKDIALTVAQDMKISQQTAKEAVQKTFDAILKGLKSDGRIELRNFGVFMVKTRPGRNARNPRTGQEFWVEEHQTVVFRPGKGMQSKVQIEKVEKKAKKTSKAAKATKSTSAKADAAVSNAQKAVSPKTAAKKPAKKAKK